jgi:hypothetical protein
MKFKFNFRKEKQEVKKESYNLANEVQSFGLQTSLPVIRESHNQDFVEYRTDDGEFYPIYLEKLYNNSPTHQGIVDTKSLMITGAGYTYDDSNLSVKQKIELTRFLDFTDGKNDIMSVIKSLAKDNQLYGSMCIETIWSLDFESIAKMTRISPRNILSGKFNDGEVENYYYSRNFTDRREEVKKINSFNINDVENHRQLLYIPNQLISNEYYGEPSYLASCNWIYMEAQTGLFYKSLMENGFNPSLIVRFFRKPKSIEERDDIVKSFKSSFGGVKNSGKSVVLFSDGKELAPEIEPIAVQNLDKQFTVISDQIVTKILTGAKVTTPELFGIAVAGKLGNGDFASQLDAFNKFVIQPEQETLNKLINKFLKINGFNINFKITPIEYGKQKNNN